MKRGPVRNISRPCKIPVLASTKALPFGEGAPVRTLGRER